MPLLTSRLLYSDLGNYDNQTRGVKGPMSLQDVLEAVHAMSQAEREQVRCLLDTLPEAPASPEESALARLREAGLLVTAGRQEASIRVRRTPVEIKGKPLSETIVDERG